jgi:hypothetical protein
MLFRVFGFALLAVALSPLYGCAGGLGWELSVHSTIPARPTVDPYLLPVPRKAWEVMPPGSRVVDNRCGADDTTETRVNGKITRSSFGRTCVVTFVTRRGEVCTTTASEDQYDRYGKSVSGRSATKPKCHLASDKERARWQLK